MILLRRDKGNQSINKYQKKVTNSLFFYKNGLLLITIKQQNKSKYCQTNGNFK